MRKTLFALIPAVVLASAVSVGVFSDRAVQAEGNATKVRAVNVDKLMQKSPKATAIMKDFQRFQQQKQDELRKEQEALAAEQQKLGPNSSQDQLNAYGAKMQAAGRKVQNAELETQKRYQETREKLLDALRPTLESYAQDNSIGMLLDSNSGGVVYVSPSWDATKDLLDRVK
jgi:outer membrane protein